jgi:CRP/FNR family transcriptional regulator
MIQNPIKIRFALAFETLYNQSMKTEKSALKTIALLQSLSEETLFNIEEKLISRTYQSGEMIHFAADECRGVSFIASGEVVIDQLSPEGRKIVLVRLGAGEAFNVVPPLLNEKRNKGNATAQTDCTLYFLRSADYLQALADHEDFSQVILRHFATQIDHLTNLVETVALHSVRARLARFLIDQADGKFTHTRWTQDEIADQIGTVRDMVGRILRSFTAANLIERGRGRIELTNRAGLEQEANS